MLTMYVCMYMSRVFNFADFYFFCLCYVCHYQQLLLYIYISCMVCKIFHAQRYHGVYSVGVASC
jgi:hypothetical protein